jgi:feruloyl esterase
MVFDDPKWDFKAFNFDSGVKLADEKQARNLNANDPNLKAFEKRGGKLIIYHGWSDAAISAYNTIDYYNSLVATMGERETDSFVRVFLAPGMQHCFGGPGPNSFGQLGIGTAPLDAKHNINLALEEWVDKGTAPGRLIASKYNNDTAPAQGVKMTRPLCPFPKIAQYKGSGDTNDEVNFVCAEPKEVKERIDDRVIR